MIKDPPMTVREVIADFWFDWEDQELTREERRSRLIDAGCDPDASFRRIMLGIRETEANREFEKGLQEVNKN